MNKLDKQDIQYFLNLIRDNLKTNTERRIEQNIMFIEQIINKY